MNWKGGHGVSQIRYKSELESLANRKEEREWLSLEEVDDQLVAPDAYIDALKDMATAMLDQSMSVVLTLREKEILKDFSNGIPQSETAVELEISPQRVSQLREQALSKLRHPVVRSLLRPLLDGFD